MSRSSPSLPPIGNSPAPQLASTAAISLNAPTTHAHTSPSTSLSQQFALSNSTLKYLSVAALTSCTTLLLVELYHRLKQQKKTKRKSNISSSSTSHYDADSRSLIPRNKIFNEEFFQSDIEWLQPLGHIDFGTPARQQLFELSDSTIFTNHGSYGTCPSYVLQKQQALLTLVDRHPDLYYRKYNYLAHRHAVEKISVLLGRNNIDANDIVFTINATTAVNAVLNSITVSAGDIILSFDTTYNACKNAMYHTAERHGAQYIELPLQLPIKDEQQYLRQLSEAIEQYGERIKFVLVDTISSPIPVIQPYKQLCALCNRYSIPVMINAAHSIGQQSADELDVGNVGCDYFSTNVHKWAYAPKGCALLWAAKKHQKNLHPVVTSHFWREEYTKRFFLQGTKDDTAYLCSAHCVDWMNAIGIERIQQYNRQLANWAEQYVSREFHTESDRLFPQHMAAPNMKAVKLTFLTPAVYQYKYDGNPRELTIDQVHAESLEWVHQALLELCDDQRSDAYNLVTALLYTKHDMSLWVRLSTNIYNTKDDYVRLVQVFKRYAQDLNQSKLKT